MKKPAAIEITTGTPNSANSTRRLRFTPRQTRILTALYLREDGWLMREEVDRIAGASNGPQIISEIRTGLLGHDGIEMERIEASDRDGKPCRPGRYRLTDKGRSLATSTMHMWGGGEQ